MLEQQGVALTFYAFFVESKVGKPGLTVTVDVWERTATTSTEIVSGGSATELGDGLYFYQLASGSVDAEAEYIAVFKTGTTTVDQQHIPALWVVGKAGIENLDALISSRLASASYTAPPSAAAVADQVWDEAIAGHLTAGSTGLALNSIDPDGIADTVAAALSGSEITVVQPVEPGTGNFTIVRGDDYDQADGSPRDISFSSASWPDLTGGTVRITARRAGAAPFTKALSIVSSSGATQQVRLTITAAETGALTVGKYSFDIEAVLVTSTHRVTLVLADMTVLQDQT